MIITIKKKHTTPEINSKKNFLASEDGIPMSGSNF